MVESEVVLPPPVGVNIPISKTGISFLRITEFVSKCGGPPALVDMTTREVCTKFLIPKCEGLTYCEYLKKTVRLSLEPANVFICHCWSYKFLDVFETLRDKFRSKPSELLWFDMFCQNQCIETSEKSMDWFGTEYKLHVSAFQRMILIFTTWNDPQVLGRIWCLYELYCREQSKKSLEVAFCKRSLNLLMDCCQTDEFVVPKISMATANAFKKLDKRSIKRIIKFATTFAEANKRIRYFITRSFVGLFEHLMKSSKTTSDLYKTNIMLVLHGMYVADGAVERGESLLRECLQNRMRLLGRDNVLVMVTSNALALHLEDREKFDEAEEIYTSSIVQLRCMIQKPPADEEQHLAVKPVLITLSTNLAALLLLQSKYTQAEAQYMTCLTLCREHLGDDHEQTLSVMNHLGKIFNDKANFPAALFMLEQCCRLWKSLPTEVDPADPALATAAAQLSGGKGGGGAGEEVESSSEGDGGMLESLTNLAIVYKNMGDYCKALPLFRKGYGCRKESFGKTHPHTLTSLYHLAVCTQAAGDLEEAQRMLIKCLDRRQLRLGPTHKDTLTAMTKLASVYRHSGRFEQAQSLLLTAVDARLHALGRNHPDFLSSLHGLANLFKTRGRHEDAEKLYVQCLTGRVALLGENHPDCLIVINNLGNLYNNWGQYERALQLLSRCHERRVLALGAEHPDTLVTVNSLGSVHSNTGNYSEAAKLFDECLAARKKVLPPEHPLILVGINNLASLYFNQAQYPLAAPLYEEVLHSQRRKLGDRNPLTLISSYNVAMCCLKTDKVPLARSLLLECLEYRQQVLGTDHRDTLQTMASLAALLQTQGEIKKALKISSQCLRGREVTLGQDHPDTIESRANVAKLKKIFHSSLQRFPTECKVS